MALFHKSKESKHLAEKDPKIRINEPKVVKMLVQEERKAR